jgi:hypothetical protein
MLCLTLGVCLSLWLAACAPQVATPASLASPSPAASPISSTPQAAAPTNGAVPTLGAAPAASPAAAETPAPEAPTALPPAEPPTAAPQAPCVNDARFIRDVTIPDGTQFLPGQLLVKKWGVQNAGSCNWGANYRLVFIGGDSLAAASEVALYPARAGADATWEIPMVAPQTPGAYTSRWQARDPAGNLFGAVVFIKINVIPMPTAPSP